MSSFYGNIYPMTMDANTYASLKDETLELCLLYIFVRIYIRFIKERMNMNYVRKKLVMKVLKEKFGVCRLDSTNSIPGWATNSEFFSITKTLDELSIVCCQNNIPDGIKCEKDWRILKVEGPLDFSLVGILASISTTLAKSGISIFAISTYDTDYILVKDRDIYNTITALCNDGYEIIN